MNKLAHDLRITALASVGGLLTFSMFLMGERVNSYYTYLSEEKHEPFKRYVEPLEWIPFLVWHAIIFIVVAFIAHRYFADPTKSPFLLWQLIGISVLLGWLFTLLVATGIGFLIRPNPYVFDRMLEALLSWDTARFVAAIFTGNVIYASLLQSAVKHYVKIPSSLAEDRMIAPPVRQTSVCRLSRL